MISKQTGKEYSKEAINAFRQFFAVIGGSWAAFASDESIVYNFESRYYALINAPQGVGADENITQQTKGMPLVNNMRSGRGTRLP